MSWSKIILFGDSLTQQSFSAAGGWATLLADRFQRIADVVTRGFSGYNTRWCKALAPKVLNKDLLKDCSCLTIFLGANDCSLDVSLQHVPLDEFRSNLEAIVKLIENNGVSKDKLILITPPIYFQDDFAEWCKSEGRPYPARANDRQEPYGKVVLEIGQSLGITTLDTYSAFIKDGRGKELFRDGLHFSPKGTELFYSLLAPLVEEKVLMYQGENKLSLNYYYPLWDQIKDIHNPDF